MPKWSLSLLPAIVLAGCQSQPQDSDNINGCYILDDQVFFKISENRLRFRNADLAEISLVVEPSGQYYHSEPGIFVSNAGSEATIQIDTQNEFLAGIAESDLLGNFDLLIPTDAQPGEGRRTLVRARRQSDLPC